MIVELEVNGKKVKLKEFPQKALAGVIIGFVKSLNIEEEPKEVKIYIKLNED